MGVPAVAVARRAALTATTAADSGAAATPGGATVGGMRSRVSGYGTVTAAEALRCEGLGKSWLPGYRLILWLWLGLAHQCCGATVDAAAAVAPHRMSQGRRPCRRRRTRCPWALGQLVEVRPSPLGGARDLSSRANAGVDG